MRDSFYFLMCTMHLLFASGERLIEASFIIEIVCAAS
jgi:hypothetical protein